MSNDTNIVKQQEDELTAPIEHMQELHGQLAKELRNIIVGGEVVKDKEGMPVRLTPSPAALNVARQFLKDNNIQANPNKGPVKDLCDDLPIFDD